MPSRSLRDVRSLEEAVRAGLGQHPIPSLERGLSVAPIEMKLLIGRFGPIFPTHVNNDLELDAALEKGGYDKDSCNHHVWSWKPEEQHNNFPRLHRGVHYLDLELYEFEREIGGPEALRIMKAEGYQPADLRALIQFTTDNPVKSLQRPIIAPAALWKDPHGRTQVACATGDLIRTLVLTWWETKFLPQVFSPKYQFLVYRPEAVQEPWIYDAEVSE